MERFNWGYAEVIPDLLNEDEFKEIQLNTGGTQSTLQDIKVAERAGGYCYINSSGNLTRNRFIYWRSIHDVLELSEISLDFNLRNNNVRYKFNDTPVLSITITEQESTVVILVATVSSLHRFSFPHPKLDRQTHPNENYYSIFRNPSPTRENSTCYVINQTAFAKDPVPKAAASYILPHAEDAYFALSYQDGLVLYTMNLPTGHTVSNMLKDEIISKMFTNFKKSLSRRTINFSGISNSSDADYATSMVFCNFNDHIFLIVLYRDDIIRLWSTSYVEVLHTMNCGTERSATHIQGPQVNALRKVSESQLCAYICYAQNSEFMFLDIVQNENSSYSLVCTKTVPALQTDLTDFVVSNSKIWSLWGELSISSYSLLPGSGMRWMPAAMELPPDRCCISLGQDIDPRQGYCSYIFHPGNFNRREIAKALTMFHSINLPLDLNVPLSVLKERVCHAVENEIQKELKGFDATDDEYVSISSRIWERFYSCCEQYHVKFSEPIGMVYLEAMQGVCIVKKNAFSLLRPCEPLENLMFSGEQIIVNSLFKSYFSDDSVASESLINLVILLSKLEDLIPDDIKNTFDLALYEMVLPNVIVQKLASKLFASSEVEKAIPRTFIYTMEQKMPSGNRLNEAMALLLNLLRIECPMASNTDDDFEKFIFANGNLFRSDIGLSVLSESIRQTALTSYAMCRNLLFLQQIYMDTVNLSCDTMEVLRSQFMPETELLVQCYFTVVWICETPINLSQIAVMDSNSQRSNALQFTHSRPLPRSQHITPLVRVFLSSKGLQTALLMFSQQSFTRFEGKQWQFTLLPLVNIVFQILWPIAEDFTFGEWLLANRQYLTIQEYVRQLNKWCEKNNCSRLFILAVSLLETGEPHKAFDMFLLCVRGVLKEKFLNDKILEHKPLSNNEAMVQYYLKVIQMFEHHNCSDCTILLAQTAIALLGKTHSQLPMFQSIIFTNHLSLEHYEEAYHSLVFNADSYRREDCLRQLVIALFDDNRLDLLMKFPLATLQDQFENIVISRARSLPIENNKHYDFLYAFQISKENLRRASAIMYEQAMRINNEISGKHGLKKRYDSLLLCLNCLHLTDERFQWIAKPVMNDSFYSEMDVDDEIKSRVLVVEIPEIEKELLMAEAALDLVKHGHKLTQIEAHELSLILVSYKLYSKALKLAKGNNISFVHIFESLTIACVEITAENSTNWSWLQENDISDLPYQTNVGDLAWLFLRQLMEDNEQFGSTLLRKTVVQGILKLNTFIPSWLYNWYKADNAPELMRELMNHGRLLEATDLAKEYIWALLGRGHEYFNIPSPITAPGPSMCIPVQEIDLLLHGLRENSSEEEYKEAHLQLEELVLSYIQTAETVSTDKFKYYKQKELDSSIMEL